MCLVSNSLPRQLFAYLRYLFLSRLRMTPLSLTRIIQFTRRVAPHLVSTWRDTTKVQYSTTPLTVAYFKISCDHSKRSVVVLSRRVCQTVSLLMFVLVSHSSSIQTTPRDQTRLCVTRGLCQTTAGLNGGAASQQRLYLWEALSIERTLSFLQCL